MSTSYHEAGPHGNMPGTGGGEGQKKARLGAGLFIVRLFGSYCLGMNALSMEEVPS